MRTDLSTFSVLQSLPTRKLRSESWKGRSLLERRWERPRVSQTSHPARRREFDPEIVALYPLKPLLISRSSSAGVKSYWLFLTRYRKFSASSFIFSLRLTDFSWNSDICSRRSRLNFFWTISSNSEIWRINFGYYPPPLDERICSLTPYSQNLIAPPLTRLNIY